MSSRPKAPTIEDLRPNSLNPRRISPEQSLNLARSMDQFGDIGGIVWNRTTGNLIAGHQRMALISQDPDARLVIDDRERQTGFVESHGDRFAFRVVEWDEIQERQAMVSANKNGGDWDTKALQKLLRETPDPALMGFSAAEMEKLFPPPPPTLEEQPEPDDEQNRGIRHCCPRCGHEWSGRPA